MLSTRRSLPCRSTRRTGSTTAAACAAPRGAPPARGCRPRAPAPCRASASSRACSCGPPARGVAGASAETTDTHQRRAEKSDSSRGAAETRGACLLRRRRTIPAEQQFSFSTEEQEAESATTGTFRRPPLRMASVMALAAVTPSITGCAGRKGGPGQPGVAAAVRQRNVTKRGSRRSSRAMLISCAGGGGAGT